MTRTDRSCPPALREVTPAVLAGGNGARMGRPKLLPKIDGTPILPWLHQQFRRAGLNLSKRVV